MAIAACVTDGPTFLSAQTAEPPVTEQADTTAAIEVEIQRRFNELRSELLDERSDSVGRWLAVTAILVTVFGVGIALFGILGFSKFQTEARLHVGGAEKSAEEAKAHLEAIKDYRQQSERIFQEIRETTSEDIHDPGKAKRIGEVVQDVRRSPDASPLDIGIADAYALQQNGKIQEAIDKWRAIASLTEDIDNGLAARAWFSIGYLLHEGKQGEALKANAGEVLDAYDRAIRLNSDYFVAYHNRGATKDTLGLHLDAIADYDQAVRLNPQYAKAYSNRGVAKVSLGLYKEAIADHDQAILLDPDSAVRFFNRGIAKAGSDDAEGARSDFQTALDLAERASDHDLKTAIQQRLQALDDAGRG